MSGGASGSLTAVVDGNVRGRVPHKGAVRRRRRVGWGLGRVAEGVAQEVDGVSLEAESDVGVDDCGHARGERRQGPTPARPGGRR